MLKILCINIKPDLSYFTKRGLEFELEYLTIKKTFPISFITITADKKGAMYTPYPVEDIANIQGYDFIIVGWKPKDYGPEMKYSGGYTHKTPTAKGAYWMTVRQDGNPTYVIHEMHHALVRKLMAMTGDYIADHMDLDSKGRTFYLNDQPENPESNYAQTWNEIKPYLDMLNGKSDVIITREKDTKKETTGTLVASNAGAQFSCKTLELPWKDNAPNISCIPKGFYRVKWTFSPRLMKYTYEIQGVPNRSGIRFHSANYYYNLLGCIGLGDMFKDINNDGQVDIVNSKKTMELFNTFMNKRDFNLIIK